MTADIITILNRLNRKDSASGLDEWHKTVLHNIEYKVKCVTNTNGTTVNMGQAFTILIPFDDMYAPYAEWVSNPSDGYTLSQNDIIIIGYEVDDDIAPENVIKIKNQYAPKVCNVRSILEVPDKYNAKYRFRIEGV